jgi:D-alanine-D-alanine ligase
MKIAIVQGGPSPEAEVSRRSAQCVEDALRGLGHETRRMELGAGLAAELLSFAPAVIFPAVHGRQGEDGCLQGLLEILAIPYVGSEVRGSAIAADKVASKVFFRAAGLDLAREMVLRRDDAGGDLLGLLSSLRSSLSSELIVKPAQGGSTLGISRIRPGDGVDVFEAALSSAFEHDCRVLVEEFLVGKEVTCAVLEDLNGIRALPVTLLNARASDWMDFESKYRRGGAEHHCPAPIEEELSERIQQASLAAHRSLGLRDLSRADFIITPEGRPVILEVNTLPGMTDVSLYPEAAQAAGIAFPSLLEILVETARLRPVPLVVGAEPLPQK